MNYQYPVLDGHYHILLGWQNAAGQDFIQSTKAYLDSRGFSSLNICAVPFLAEYSTDVSNNILAALCKVQMPELYIHGGIVYDTASAQEQMQESFAFTTQYRELMEIGFDGIKMLETKPSEIRRLKHSMDDELYEDWFAAIERDGTHIVWHVADPRHFWIREYVSDEFVERGWFYGDGTYPTQEEIFRQVETVLSRHPKLNVTFAHFYFHGDLPDRLENLFVRYPNVNVDITPGWEMYAAFAKDPTYWRGFFTRHADRIGFGTDSCDENEGSPEIADIVYRFLTTSEEQEVFGIRFSGIALEGIPLQMILEGNFRRRVGERPRPICRDALRRYIEKYRSLIADDELRKLIDRAKEAL